MDKLFEVISGWLSSVLTTPLAYTLMAAIALLYFGVSQSSAFRTWLVRDISGQTIIDTYINFLNASLIYISNVFFAQPSGLPRISRFLSFSLAYTTFVYISSWAVGANLRIDTIDVLDNQPPDDRLIFLVWVTGIAAAIFLISSSVGKADHLVCFLLGDTPGSIITSNERLFERPFRPYKLKLAAVGGLLMFLSLLRTFEPWAIDWVVDPGELLTLSLRFAHPETIPTTRFGIMLLIAVGVGISIASIGHAFVAFSCSVAACFAVTYSIPYHTGLPILVAIATFFYNTRLPLYTAIFVTPVFLLATVVLYGSSLEGPLGISHVFFATLLALPLTIFVSVLEAPIGLPGIAGRILVGIFAAGPLVGAIVLRNTDVSPSHAKLIFVFWLLLPLLTSGFDIVAWKAGLGSGRQLVKSMAITPTDAADNQNAPPRDALTFVALILYSAIKVAGIALLIIFSFCLIMPSVVAFANFFLNYIGLGHFVDTKALVANILQRPLAADSLWITALLLSPLVPTALNVVFIVCLSLTLPLLLLQRPTNTASEVNIQTSGTNAELSPERIARLLLAMIASAVLLRIFIYLAYICLLGAVWWVQYGLRWAVLLFG